MEIVAGVNSIINELDMGHVFSLSGHPSWSFVNISGNKSIRKCYLKRFSLEMFKRGVLILGSHNVNFSHTEADITQLLTAYAEVIQETKRGIDASSIEGDLECEPLINLFKVR